MEKMKSDSIGSQKDSKLAKQPSPLVMHLPDSSGHNSASNEEAIEEHQELVEPAQ